MCRYDGFVQLEDEDGILIWIPNSSIYEIGCRPVVKEKCKVVQLSKIIIECVVAMKMYVDLPGIEVE